jgi:hypothetical protein
VEAATASALGKNGFRNLKQQEDEAYYSINPCCENGLVGNEVVRVVVQFWFKSDRVVTRRTGGDFRIYRPGITFNLYV